MVQYHAKCKNKKLNTNIEAKCQTGNWCNGFVSICKEIPTRLVEPSVYYFSFVFQVMLQRGVLLSTLDASYVSSTSWYFLVMFGLRAAINMFLRDAASNEEVNVTLTPACTC